jgi:hypothetical protein
MFRGLFKKKRSFDDAAKTVFVDAIASMLKNQIIVAGEVSMDDENGCPNRKALGYVFGYVDTALKAVGQDTKDMSISVPITFEVINRLWPGRAKDYMDFILKNNNDELIIAGANHGGQQFIQYSKKDSKGGAMGLARFLMQGETVQDSKRRLD